MQKAKLLQSIRKFEENTNKDVAVGIIIGVIGTILIDEFYIIGFCMAVMIGLFAVFKR